MAVATIFRQNPVVFISLADKHITRPQDFVGKTIRASANIAPTLNAMMAKLGIGPSQYTYRDAPSDINLFVSGEIPVWGVFINSFAVASRKQAISWTSFIRMITACIFTPTASSPQMN